MKIPLDRGSGRSLYLQIADFIDQQISAGNLPPGIMLPPIRTLAEQLAVSKTTITMAYAELEAAGRVAGHVGQGTMVTAAAPVLKAVTPPLALPQRAPGAAVINDLLRIGERPGLINFTTSSPAPDQLPVDAFARCLRTVLQEDGAAAFLYGPAGGYEPLRQSVARHITERGIVATPDEVLITAGAQQALDLSVRGLVAPGEWVVVESPCYMGALEVLEVHGARVAPAPMDEGGLIVEQLEPLFRRLRPRMLYTTPTFQNPTGASLSLERRRRLVELAARWNVIVVEDTVCSELELTGPAPPALRALGGPVVHCGSFSKGLLPGIRIGYLVAAPEVIQRLTLLKQASDLNSPGLLQRALARFLDAGHLAPHLRRVLGVYRERRSAALAALERHFPAAARWTRPAGGLHIWVTMPPPVDVSALYVAAIGAGVGFTPGVLFFPAGGASHHLRLSYGAEPPERIEAGIARLASLLRSPGMTVRTQNNKEATTLGAGPLDEQYGAVIHPGDS